MAQLVWYRNNLRTVDCEPLNAACASGEQVHACFLFSTTQWQNHGWGPNRIEYTRKSVAALEKKLQALNIPFHIFFTPTFDKAPGVIRVLAQELGCSTVHWSREYEVNELRRDLETKEILDKYGITSIEYDDDVVVPPDVVFTKSNDPFKVFTPYKKRWLEQLDRRLAETGRIQPTNQESDAKTELHVPDVLTGYEEFAPQDPWAVGEDQALTQLDTFITERGSAYKDNRDIPSVDGTSSLSPCLAVGAISPRTCVLAARNAIKANPKAAIGLDTWISELAWRDFYKSIAFHFEHICRGQPFKPETKSIPWRDDDEAFQAWCTGQTGYPIVDAAMRALVATGWMHNRLRMVTAQFLTKHLLIDWRRGEEFFAHHLIDIDFASNNGGWQWSASTGTDAAPYFRIFNPTTQGRRFDPEGVYIRRFVPELASLDAKHIHEPDTLPPLERTQIDYPEPIVEQSYGRNRAITAFVNTIKQPAETS